MKATQLPYIDELAPTAMTHNQTIRVGFDIAIGFFLFNILVFACCFAVWFVLFLLAMPF